MTDESSENAPPTQPQVGESENVPVVRGRAAFELLCGDDLDGDEAASSDSDRDNPIADPNRQRHRHRNNVTLDEALAASTRSAPLSLRARLSDRFRAASSGSTVRSHSDHGLDSGSAGRSSSSGGSGDRGGGASAGASLDVQRLRRSLLLTTHALTSPPRSHARTHTQTHNGNGEVDDPAGNGAGAAGGTAPPLSSDMFTRHRGSALAASAAAAAGGDAAAAADSCLLGLGVNGHNRGLLGHSGARGGHSALLHHDYNNNNNHGFNGFDGNIGGYDASASAAAVQLARAVVFQHFPALTAPLGSSAVATNMVRRALPALTNANANAHTSASMYASTGVSGVGLFPPRQHQQQQQQQQQEHTDQQQQFPYLQPFPFQPQLHEQQQPMHGPDHGNPYVFPSARAGSGMGRTPLTPYIPHFAPEPFAPPPAPFAAHRNPDQQQFGQEQQQQHQHFPHTPGYPLPFAPDFSHVNEHLPDPGHGPGPPLAPWKSRPFAPAPVPHIPISMPHMHRTHSMSHHGSALPGIPPQHQQQPQHGMPPLQQYPQHEPQPHEHLQRQHWDQPPPPQPGAPNPHGEPLRPWQPPAFGSYSHSDTQDYGPGPGHSRSHSHNHDHRHGHGHWHERGDGYGAPMGLPPRTPFMGPASVHHQLRQQNQQEDVLQQQQQQQHHQPYHQQPHMQQRPPLFPHRAAATLAPSAAGSVFGPAGRASVPATPAPTARTHAAVGGVTPGTTSAPLPPLSSATKLRAGYDGVDGFHGADPAYHHAYAGNAAQTPMFRGSNRGQGTELGALAPSRSATPSHRVDHAREHLQQHRLREQHDATPADSNSNANNNDGFDCNSNAYDKAQQQHHQRMRSSALQRQSAVNVSMNANPYASHKSAIHTPVQNSVDGHVSNFVRADGSSTEHAERGQRDLAARNGGDASADVIAADASANHIHTGNSTPFAAGASVPSAGPRPNPFALGPRRQAAGSIALGMPLTPAPNHTHVHAHSHGHDDGHAYAHWQQHQQYQPMLQPGTLTRKASVSCIRERIAAMRQQTEPHLHPSPSPSHMSASASFLGDNADVDCASHLQLSQSHVAHAEPHAHHVRSYLHLSQQQPQSQVVFAGGEGLVVQGATPARVTRLKIAIVDSDCETDDDDSDRDCGRYAARKDSDKTAASPVFSDVDCVRDDTKTGVIVSDVDIAVSRGAAQISSGVELSVVIPDTIALGEIAITVVLSEQQQGQSQKEQQPQSSHCQHQNETGQLLPPLTPPPPQAKRPRIAAAAAAPANSGTAGTNADDSAESDDTAQLAVTVMVDATTVSQRESGVGVMSDSDARSDKSAVATTASHATEPSTVTDSDAVAGALCTGERMPILELVDCLQSASPQIGRSQSADNALSDCGQSSDTAAVSQPAEACDRESLVFESTSSESKQIGVDADDND